MREIENHGLEFPDERDPQLWNLDAIFYINWLRNEASFYGYNTEKLIMGHVLDLIVGDDVNKFLFYKQDEAQNNKDLVTKRLKLEISTPELPESVKGKLQDVLKRIDEFDWNTKERWENARDIWLQANDEINKEIDNDQSLSESISYASMVKKLLSDSYNSFYKSLKYKRQ